MIFDKIDIVTRREDSEDSQALVIFRLQEIVACVHGETSRGNLSCFETMRMECIWFNWCSDGIKFNIVFSESNWSNWCITRYCSKCKCFLVISISSKLSLQTKLANNPLADCFFFFFYLRNRAIRTLRYASSHPTQKSTRRNYIPSKYVGWKFASKPNLTWLSTVTPPCFSIRARFTPIPSLSIYTALIVPTVYANYSRGPFLSREKSRAVAAWIITQIEERREESLMALRDRSGWNRSKK